MFSHLLAHRSCSVSYSRIFSASCAVFCFSFSRARKITSIINTYTGFMLKRKERPFFWNKNCLAQLSANFRFRNILHKSFGCKFFGEIKNFLWVSRIVSRKFRQWNLINFRITHTKKRSSSYNKPIILVSCHTEQFWIGTRTNENSLQVLRIARMEEFLAHVVPESLAPSLRHS